MEFENVLKNAESTEITKEEALYLFKETRRWDKALKLFETAGKVRDEEAGSVCKLMGFICCITHCTTDPTCSYCFSWRSPSSFAQEMVLSSEELADAAKAIEKTGVKRIEIAGGTLWGDEGRETTMKAVEAVRKASNLEIWINNGPAFTEVDVFKFKELGVDGVACNFETINANVFKEFRPGDDLEARKRIVEATEKSGLGIDNTLMVGLGESWDQPHPYQDWVDFLFYFKQFKNFKILEAHPLHPMSGSPTENHPSGSSFEAAKAKAIGRLIFRDIDIAGAGDLLGIMSGANLIMHCVSVNKKERVRGGQSWGDPVEVEYIGDTLALTNHLPAIVKSVKEIGMEIEPDISDRWLR